MTSSKSTKTNTVTVNVFFSSIKGCQDVTFETEQPKKAVNEFKKFVRETSVTMFDLLFAKGIAAMHLEIANTYAQLENRENLSASVEASVHIHTLEDTTYNMSKVAGVFFENTTVAQHLKTLTPEAYEVARECYEKFVSMNSSEIVSQRNLKLAEVHKAQEAASKGEETMGKPDTKTSKRDQDKTTPNNVVPIGETKKAEETKPADTAKPAEQKAPESTDTKPADTSATDAKPGESKPNDSKENTDSNTGEGSANGDDKTAKSASAWDKKRIADKKYHDKMKALKAQGENHVVSAQIERLIESVQGHQSDTKAWGSADLTAKLDAAAKLLKEASDLAKATTVPTKEKQAQNKEVKVGDVLAIASKHTETYLDFVDDKKELESLTVTKIDEDKKHAMCKAASGKVRVKLTHVA